MVRLLRFPDLKKHNVVRSWPQLKRLQEKHGFPKGRMIGPNTRAWTDEEIDEWVATRPVDGPAPRGAAKAKAEARRADTTDNTEQLDAEEEDARPP
jgi:predicted DNA-binding transcriptional regulator AlpA